MILHRQNVKKLAASELKLRKTTYYYYYKHNKITPLNLGTKRAHEQLKQIFELMSLPENIVKLIRDESETAANLRIKSDKILLADKLKELGEEEKKLFSLEEKWISNKINHDAYQNDAILFQIIKWY